MEDERAEREAERRDQEQQQARRARLRPIGDRAVEDNLGFQAISGSASAGSDELLRDALGAAMPSAAGSQRMPDDEEYQFAPSESSGEDDEEAEEEKEPLSEEEESVKRPKRNARLIEDSDQDIQNGYLERARQAIVDDDEEASPSQGR